MANTLLALACVLAINLSGAQAATLKIGLYGIDKYDAAVQNSFTTAVAKAFGGAAADVTIASESYRVTGIFRLTGYALPEVGDPPFPTSNVTELIAADMGIPAESLVLKPECFNANCIRLSGLESQYKARRLLGHLSIVFVPYVAPAADLAKAKELAGKFTQVTIVAVKDKFSPDYNPPVIKSPSADVEVEVTLSSAAVESIKANVTSLTAALKTDLPDVELSTLDGNFVIPHFVPSPKLDCKIRGDCPPPPPPTPPPSPSPPPNVTTSSSSLSSSSSSSSSALEATSGTLSRNNVVHCFTILGFLLLLVV